MQDILNTILKCIKWPLAVLMLLMFLPLLRADLALIEVTLSQRFFMTFVAPMIGIIVLWFVIPGLSGSHFSIFEHEFTHMFAALLTFHRPKSIEVEPDKGGSFGYYGRGNWFITLAPYFVPTFPLLMIVFSIIWCWLDKPLPDMFIPVLGALFGYHLASNAAQIHGKQTDFAKAGWIFSILFLPTANLFTFGFIWAFAAHHWVGVIKWWRLVLHQTEFLIYQLF